MADKPTEHGFPTDLWTGPRLAHLIRQEFGIELNPKYLTAWLRRRGFTPQLPHYWTLAKILDQPGYA